MSSLLKLAPATQIDKEVILQKRERGPEVAAKVWFAFWMKKGPCQPFVFSDTLAKFLNLTPWSSSLPPNGLSGLEFTMSQEPSKVLKQVARGLKDVGLLQVISEIITE